MGRADLRPRHFSVLSRAQHGPGRSAPATLFLLVCTSVWAAEERLAGWMARLRRVKLGSKRDRGEANQVVSETEGKETEGRSTSWVARLRRGKLGGERD